jgi:hypothetical protein
MNGVPINRVHVLHSDPTHSHAAGGLRLFSTSTASSQTVTHWK